MAITERVKEFTYVLEEDRQRLPSQQTTWRLQTLSSLQAEEIESSGLAEAAKARRVLDAALVGWERFPTADGSNAPFQTQERDGRRAITDSTAALIRPSWAVELADAILAETNLD